MLAADFGDAPAPYKTLIANVGAQHEAVGPTLGALRDTEADGIPSAAADGDGTDEDGVIFGTLRVGQLGASATVNVQSAPAGARLDAWIDFNGDGSWGGPGEQIANNLAVVAGNNAVTFDVPSSAFSGNVFARFRLSTAGNLAPGGVAADGEVEDYRATIAPPGAGSGVFSTEKVITSAPDQAFATAAVDLDDDGDMDVLATGLGTNVIRWYENNGTETFTAREVGTGDLSVRQILGADVDGDGDMDVVTASNTVGRVVWFENNGSESFTLRPLATVTGAFGVVIADIDGDGDMDASSVGGNRIYLHTNNGSQTFATTNVTSAANVQGAISVDAADVDGDGDMDLLSTSSNDDTVAWYENIGAGSFTERIITTTMDGARSVFAVDLDKDGDMDVVAGSTGDDRVEWWENNGSQTFAPHNITMGADQLSNVQVGDLDGDGDYDVLSASFNDDEVNWYVNNGAGAFTTRQISISGDGARTVVAGDVDGDGDLDVVAASSADDTVAWYENRPAGDYDRDSDIDGGDFLLWQRDFGVTGIEAGSGADGNGNQAVDAGDLALWASGFGQGSATVSSAGSASANLVASADGPGSSLGASNWFVMAPASQGAGSGAAAIERQPASESLRTTGINPAARADGAVSEGWDGDLFTMDAVESGDLSAELVDELMAAWAGVS
jgi:hypothetical protein